MTMLDPCKSLEKWCSLWGDTCNIGNTMIDPLYGLFGFCSGVFIYILAYGTCKTTCGKWIVRNPNWCVLVGRSPRVFTSISPVPLPNSSTKFCLINPSTTFWDIPLNIVFSLTSKWWRIAPKIKIFSYSDLHQYRINWSLSNTQPIHQVSAESINTFLRYPTHSQKRVKT